MKKQYQKKLKMKLSYQKKKKKNLSQEISMIMPFTV